MHDIQCNIKLTPKSVVADAMAQSPKPTHLITEGGIQSNHVRQVAAVAAKLGLKATIFSSDSVPERTKASSQYKKEYTSLGNVQLATLMSGSYESGSMGEGPRIAGGYWIPSGASAHPFGGLGYARWAFEVVEQERQMGVEFDVIIVALMSCSTLAGMVAGFKLIEKLARQNGEATAKKRRILGVQAGPKDSDEVQEIVLRIAKTAAEKIGLDVGEITDKDFEIDTRWHGGAYGQLDDQTKGNIKLAASTEGLVTDPVYSGKALSGMCEMIQAEELSGNVLFVHTGGVLSLSAYPDLR